MWIFWLVLAVGLIIAEIFTLGFVLFWFGVGALAAAVIAFSGLGLGWQFAVFAIVSIVLTAMSRTIFARYLPHSEGNAIKSGIESLPGKIGTVSSASKGALNEAAVKVFGSTWTAFPTEDEDALTEGEKVEVVEVRGSSIYVRRVREGLPSWRGDEKN
jgi:membrane protein implicated in regulation of membrane protease activity